MILPHAQRHLNCTDSNCYLLRWGWSPKPPEGVMVDEYDEAFTFWVNRSIPRLGRIRTFDNGKYTVAKHHVSHVDLMELIAKARTIG